MDSQSVKVINGLLNSAINEAHHEFISNPLGGIEEVKASWELDTFRKAKIDFNNLLGKDDDDCSDDGS